MDNKGMTITELLVSICIISIVLLLLFSLLLQVRSEDNKSSIQSNFVIDQSTMIKAIEEDVTDYGVKRVSACTLSEQGIDNSIIVSGYEDKYKCLKIEYKKDFLKSNIAFLSIYNYYTKYDYQNGKYVGKGETSWMISYKRGYYKEYNFDGSPKYQSFFADASTMKELPEEVDLSDASVLNFTALSENINAASLVFPIKNLTGEHYDVNIGFTYTGNNLFKCKANNAATNKFSCNCSSSNSLCNQIYE